IVRTSHSGNFALQLGASVATSGDSTATQIIAIPPDATTISIWYKMTCPDTLTYDWTTVSFMDNITKVVTTVLPRTCATNSSWVNVTAPVGASAGHTVTLTLTSHDDNFPGDPSFVLYDDISVF